MVKLALFGTAFVAVSFIGVLASDGAFARGGGGGHGSGSHSTSGYSRNNGTYVQSYHATNPNSTKLDNYSTKGNINPWTGKPGTKSPYGSSSAGHYYGSTGAGAVPPAYNATEWGVSYPGAIPLLPAPSGNTVLSPAAVNNPYHPHWTVQVH
jgi:hypothetical protein